MRHGCAPRRRIATGVPRAAIAASWAGAVAAGAAVAGPAGRSGGASAGAAAAWRRCLLSNPGHCRLPRRAGGSATRLSRRTACDATARPARSTGGRHKPRAAPGASGHCRSSQQAWPTSCWRGRCSGCRCSCGSCCGWRRREAERLARPGLRRAPGTAACGSRASAGARFRARAGGGLCGAGHSAPGLAGRGRWCCWGRSTIAVPRSGRRPAGTGPASTGAACPWGPAAVSTRNWLAGRCRRHCRRHRLRWRRRHRARRVRAGTAGGTGATGTRAGAVIGAKTRAGAGHHAGAAHGRARHQRRHQHRHGRRDRLQQWSRRPRSSGAQWRCWPGRRQVQCQWSQWPPSAHGCRRRVRSWPGHHGGGLAALRPAVCQQGLPRGRRRGGSSAASAATVG